MTQAARTAYELFASRQNWLRPDGRPIPRWHELNQAARFRCEAVAEVAYLYEPPSRAVER